MKQKIVLQYYLQDAVERMEVHLPPVSIKVPITYHVQPLVQICRSKKHG